MTRYLEYDNESLKNHTKDASIVTASDRSVGKFKKTELTGIVIIIRI